jgi:SAM-dependent methyltransferase
MLLRVKRGLVRVAMRTAAVAKVARGASAFHCPACGYRGPFLAAGPPAHRRRDARCPSCGAAERHRLQALVIRDVLAPLAQAAVARRGSLALAVHFAPEPQIGRQLAALYPRYLTADLSGVGVDRREDLRALSLEDASVDLVYASHVLEHVDDDRAALSEIARVLAPGGVAVLPVPVLCDATVEYGAANPAEHHHVRAPGLDYFDRYRAVFAQVDVLDSSGWPGEHQLMLHEDRTVFPTPERPLRTAMGAGPHLDYVPVCAAQV